MFRISHEDANRVCFTRNEWKEDPKLIKYDLIRLESKWLPSWYSECHIYIHYKGQIIRSLSRPTIALYGDRLFKGKLRGNKGFEYIVRIRADVVDIVTKRPDAINKCNRDLIDDDSKWRNVVIEQNQCVPVYMKRFIQNSTKRNQFSECNFKQHRQVQNEYSPFNDFEAAGKLFLPPCREMSSIVTITENIARFENKNITTLILKFEYPNNYKETTNHRAMNLYDLWSQIGGIVGIMIGYSLAQIPETIHELGTRFVKTIEVMKKIRNNI